MDIATAPEVVPVFDIILNSVPVHSTVTSSVPDKLVFKAVSKASATSLFVEPVILKPVKFWVLPPSIITSMSPANVVDEDISATAPPFHPLLSLITSVFLYECLKISLRTILLLPKWDVDPSNTLVPPSKNASTSVAWVWRTWISVSVIFTVSVSVVDNKRYL